VGEANEKRNFRFRRGSDDSTHGWNNTQQEKSAFVMRAALDINVELVRVCGGGGR